MGRRTTKVTCEACNGSKTVVVDSAVCGDCDGKGYKEGVFGEKVCSTCDGRHRVDKYGPCSACDGKGYKVEIIEDEDNSGPYTTKHFPED